MHKTQPWINQNNQNNLRFVAEYQVNSLNYDELQLLLGDDWTDDMSIAQARDEAFERCLTDPNLAPETILRAGSGNC